MSEHGPPTSTSPSEIVALISRLKQSNLSPSDAQLAERLFRLLLTLINLVERKNTSIARLKRLLFGPTSDSRSSRPAPAKQAQRSAPQDNSTESTTENNEVAQQASTPQKRRGHGRLSAARYTGAKVVRCQDAHLRVGLACPAALCTGHLYDTNATFDSDPPGRTTSGRRDQV